MAHRAGAILILLSAIALGLFVQRSTDLAPGYRRAAWGWLVLIGAQATLGAWTVIANKPADVATLHVVLGALSLTLVFLIGASAGRQLSLCAARGQSVSNESPVVANKSGVEVFVWRLFWVRSFQRGPSL